MPNRPRGLPKSRFRRNWRVFQPLWPFTGEVFKIERWIRPETGLIRLWIKEPGG
jgi:hypothetical protein